MYHKLCIAILSICTIHTSAWGREGHFITARIAEAFLRPTGRRLVESLLGQDALKLGQPFYDAAAWADRVQSDPAYAWSQPLHFINTPYRLCDGFNLGRDCSSGWCLVTGIRNYTMRVSNESLLVNERVEALKFLMHFIADVNQPLHVGFTADRGGNKISVSPPWEHATNKAGKILKGPQVKPLHVLWDSHIIQFTYVTSNSTWLKLADDLISEIQQAVYSGSQALDHPYDASLRAEESSKLACSKSYRDANNWISDGNNLSIDYYRTRARLSMDQLSRSGLDIALILNDIGDYLEASGDTDADTMSIQDDEMDWWDSDSVSSDESHVETEFLLVTP